ncbi:hypothetical protein [Salicibibacter cibi]|nr:hypothetical protein [Salicibibacter cibi]
MAIRMKKIIKMTSVTEDKLRKELDGTVLGKRIGIILSIMLMISA